MAVLAGEPGLAVFLLDFPSPSCSTIHSVRVTGAEFLCHLPLLKTSTGTYPFFCPKQTPEGRDIILSTAIDDSDKVICQRCIVNLFS